MKETHENESNSSENSYLSHPPQSKKDFKTKQDFYVLHLSREKVFFLVSALVCFFSFSFLFGYWLNAPDFRSVEELIVELDRARTNLST